MVSDRIVVSAMITIGDFASLVRVSVRMLRYYHAVGLLAPAFVNPHSGYRLYDPDNLRRLNRIVALKELRRGQDRKLAAQSKLTPGPYTPTSKPIRQIMSSSGDIDSPATGLESRLCGVVVLCAHSAGRHIAPRRSARRRRRRRSLRRSSRTTR